MSFIFEKLRLSSILEEEKKVVFYLKMPRIVWLWFKAWQKLISILWVGGWVGVGGIGTKASPSILI